MITPAFELSQDDKFLIVLIKAPYTKVSDSEIEFSDNEFRFYSKPYFLRLILPANVIENGEESAVYDAEKSSFTINVPKLNEGEFFEGLEFQTKLLSTRKPAFKSPVIEVIGGTQVDDSDGEEFTWDIIQNQYAEDEDLLKRVEGSNYGFANQKHGVFTKLRDEIPDLVDVKNPDQKNVNERRKERMVSEQDQFCDDHYLADLYQDSEIIALLKFTPYYVELFQNKSNCEVTFTDQEKERMRNLPNREYLLDHNSKQQVLLSVVDILLAYCYNFRTTEGENTVETAWTITKLSSTLSWLESFPSMDSVVASFIRRSLCYPLHRNWELSKTVLQDTVAILSLGPKMVLKCFLDIHFTFNNSDPYYLLNELYITDTCVWLQTLKSSIFTNMAEALSKVCIGKEDVDLELVELEEAAKLALEEEEPTASEDIGLVAKMEELTVNANGQQSEESSEESSDDSSSSSESDSDSELDSDDDTDESSEGSESDDERIMVKPDDVGLERKR